MNGNKRIIIALDFDNERDALAMADKLDASLCRVKVGKELFTSAGPHVVRELSARGFDVFLDLKFHDIPNTVAGAVRAAAKLGVWMVNVHASGGEAMMKAALDAARSAARPPLLIGVTVLTSLGNADLPAIGWLGTALDNVLRLAQLAQTCGLNGVVCSAAEAAPLRARHNADFALVTPGIRMIEDAAGDQQRVVTPRDAIAAGATYLVVGRPITGAADPKAKLALMQNQIAAH